MYVSLEKEHTNTCLLIKKYLINLSPYNENANVASYLHTKQAMA